MAVILAEIIIIVFLLIELVSLTAISAEKLPLQNDLSDEHHQWVVELGSGPQSTQLAQQIALELGLRYLGNHGAFDDVHIFEGKPPLINGTRKISRRSAMIGQHRWLSLVGERLQKFSKTGVAERQVALKRVKRSTTPPQQGDFNLNDPLYSKSWYMNGEVDNGYGMNIKAAWQAGYTGAGVVVTILDDGIERNHPDLKANYDALASYDFNGRDSDPTPRYDFKNTNQHGTRCAGQVAAVANNSICSVGVAFNARIGGVRMLDGKVTDSLEADALSLRLDHIDIFSASWGPPDDGETVDGPGHLARRALLKGIVKGRDGRGSIFVWSSGNGGLFDDSCACDGYANSMYTLSISSASERGQKPWYLEECASTIAATYSSGEPMFERQIVTTDLRGGCTDNHTGTSASAPIAAGLVALALEANPRLTWRDVQHIVVETSRPEPLQADGEFLTNGVGKKVSSRFGFGLMDGLAMVRLAEVWKTVPDQHICTASVNDWMTHTIPPEEPLVLTVQTNACTGTEDYVRYLEHVEARISLWYSVRGDVEIHLTSPSGTRSQLLPPRSYDDREGEFRDWPFISVQFWGETAVGNWTIEVNNVGPEENNGNLRRWSLIFHGSEIAPAMSKIRRRSTGGDLNLKNGHHLLQCPENCTNCTSQFDCLQCRPGLFLLPNTTQCLTECPPGFCPDDRYNGTKCGDCLVDDLFTSVIKKDGGDDGDNDSNRNKISGMISSVFGSNSAHQCSRCSALAVTLVIGVALLTRTPDIATYLCLFCT